MQHVYVLHVSIFFHVSTATSSINHDSPSFSLIEETELVETQRAMTDTRYGQVQQQQQPGQMQSYFPGGGGDRKRATSSGPSTTQIIVALSVLPIGGTLLFLSGLTFTGTVIGLALATPVFVIFSPVLVPAAIAIGLSMLGFLSSGAFGIVALAALSWLLNFFRSFGVPEQVKRVKQMAEQTGQEIRHKAGGAAQQLTGGT